MTKSKKIFIERREDGDYAVTREGAEKASKITETQKEAIEEARRINPGFSPDVERVRETEKGKPGRWRKA
jgi:hypothetical protein